MKKRGAIYGNLAITSILKDNFNIGWTVCQFGTQTGLIGYYFKYVDRPLCLRADELYVSTCVLHCVVIGMLF